MRLAFREEEQYKKNSQIIMTSPTCMHLSPQRFNGDQMRQDSVIEQIEGDENFTLLPSSRPQQQKLQIRVIKRSMVNRSCINTCNYSCRHLSEIPCELRESSMSKLIGLQKIDLSYNSLSDIEDIFFIQMNSLKELLMNDNELIELPKDKINKCKSLKLINVNNNLISTIPALDKISFLMIRQNPIRLITAELLNLNQFQFISFDWLDYLVDEINDKKDDFKQCGKVYCQFKEKILKQIDYELQENSSYCDFNCYFRINLMLAEKKQGISSYISWLIARSILQNDQFFINYLKSYHNELHYAEMTYNSKPLLELAFQSNRSDVIELFRLCKSNYSELASDQIYKQSIRLSCRYSNYDFFKYLLPIKNKRKIIMNEVFLNQLIKQNIQRYSRQKNGDKILHQLVRLYSKISANKIKIKLPIQYNPKIFKSFSTAVLDAHQDLSLIDHFEFDCVDNKTTPLHFAMKSKNEQLVNQLINKNYDVFAINEAGITCKFTPGSPQVSRKLVWKKQKKIIAAKWKNVEKIQQTGDIIYLDNLSNSRVQNVNKLVSTRIGYQELQPSFLSYHKPEEELSRRSDSFQSLPLTRRGTYKQDLMVHLEARVSNLQQLTWSNMDYLKKMVNIDIIIFIIQRISKLEEPEFFKKLQTWNQLQKDLLRISDKLYKEEIVLYQLFQTLDWIKSGSGGGNQEQSTLSVEISSFKGGQFWCCQNIPYD